MLVSKTKKEIIKQLELLISAFKEQYNIYKTSDYNEAQVRIDFINPLLEIFGWDVDNKLHKSQFQRDVIQEESIEVVDGYLIRKKNPDYTLRVRGIRKVFVEAKKVSIDIENSKEASFQIKRYGWSANLGISILTNFQTLIVYDCRYKPNINDKPSIARYKVFHFEDYISRIDELFELFSFDSFNAGFIDKYFALTQKETSPFDTIFLSQIEGWREKLALNIFKNNKSIEEENINFLIQRLLNRIIFLRICEDREIEKYETLKHISNYDELKKLFIKTDKKYNSGLFDFIEDNLSLKINLDKEVLIEIFEELYYPSSPYDFSIIDPLILSQIYEQYLGSKIAIVPQLSMKIIQENEVVASNGVVPTPPLITNQIVTETLDSLLSGKNLKDVKNLKIADICCGSGTFLITLFDYLLKVYIDFYLKKEFKDSSIIYEKNHGVWKLTLKVKKEILTNNIFGVDVNPYAIEVAQFSLLLKLLEDENAKSIKNYLKVEKEKILPNLNQNIKCGNSLVDDNFYNYDVSSLENDELLYRIKPFNWEDEFKFFKDHGGFDAIIGNPPYVRIQNLVKYSSEEIAYYRSPFSPYSIGKKDSFDKYYLFIERAVELVNPTGVIGYIVPHKFFIVKGGKKLRAMITKKCSISKIIHFGVTQVFEGRLTYTAIIIMEKEKRDTFYFKRISELIGISSFDNAVVNQYKLANYSSHPWIFLSKEADTLFEKIKNQSTIPLKSIAEISVGLQTSADDIFILHPIEENETSILIQKDGITWEIEREILLPSLYDVRLNLFDTPDANSYIIFPYYLDDGKAIVYSEEIMKSDFPLCFQYLTYYKTRLEKRSIGGTKNVKWYQFGRNQSLTKFHNTDKLIWKVLSTEASYTYDYSNVQFTGGGNGPYYSLLSKGEYSLYYILALLSHPLLEAIVKSGASEFQGDYYSHGKQFIENLPIQVIDFNKKEELEIYTKIIKITKELIDTKIKIKKIAISSKKVILERKLSKLRQSQINLINQIYNITSDELLSISSNQLFFTNTSVVG